jgi:hypothetical protein
MRLSAGEAPRPIDIGQSLFGAEIRAPIPRGGAKTRAPTSPSVQKGYPRTPGLDPPYGGNNGPDPSAGGDRGHKAKYSRG